MAFALTSSLEDADVTHWLSYGSLLGAVRENQLSQFPSTLSIFLLLIANISRCGSCSEKGFCGGRSMWTS
jgi:hypothetical protein